MNEPKRFFGKYRGTVVNIADDQKRGRIEVIVPDVLKENRSTWAMPCFPFTGRQMGAWMIPQIGAGVWVEFEQGDPNHPIWSGGWYGSSAEAPALAQPETPDAPNVVLQTQGQNVIRISDAAGPTGGILLKTRSGAMIAVNEDGITISNGQGATIVMKGTSVDINDGGFTVLE